MPGQINWVEIPAAGTAKARTFYNGLFSWNSSEFDGDYHDDRGTPFSMYEPSQA